MSIPARETTTATSTGQMLGQFGQQMGGGQFDQPSMGGQFGQQTGGGQFDQPSLGGQQQSLGQGQLGQQSSLGRQSSMGGQFEQPSMGGQQQMGGQFDQPSMGGQQQSLGQGQFEQPSMGGQFGQQTEGQFGQQTGGQFEQPSLGGQQQSLGQGQFEQPSLGGQQQIGGFSSSIDQPLQMAPLQRGSEEVSVRLPSGEQYRYQLPIGGPAAIPGARVREWTVVENVPLTNMSVPQGYKVVQYERDIEVDMANLAPTTTVFTTTVPEVCTPIQPCKPEIRVETTTIPPAQLDTRKKEFPGGEEVISTGPHGEKIKTTVTQLPWGGERIETKVKEPLTTGITQREDIKTTTTIKECGPLGGTTIVESHSHLVPPGYGAKGYGPQGYPSQPETAGRKGKHHEGLLGSLRGAFSRKGTEHVPPKETL